MNFVIAIEVLNMKKKTKNYRRKTWLCVCLLQSIMIRNNLIVLNIPMKLLKSEQ